MKEKKSENENIVVDKEGKEIKPKKIGFFKKVWYSIAKFEKYVEMSLEGIGRALKYLLQITAIFVFIIACIGIYSANTSLNGFIENVKDNVPDFEYSQGQITLNEEAENKVYTIKDTNLNFGTIIIDLNAEDENVIAEHENTIKNNDETKKVGVIIGKNGVIQILNLAEGVQGETRISMTYDEVMENLFGSSEIQLTKASLLEFLNGNGRTSILIVNFFSYFIAYFIIYMSSAVIYTLILGIIGYTSSKLAKIKLTFTQMLSIAAYAFTLSNILNAIYFVTNYFWGITIKYFDIAYIALAYIYLVTVMFLLKNDSLRKQENQVENDKKEEKENTDGQEQI